MKTTSRIRPGSPDGSVLFLVLLVLAALSTLVLTMASRTAERIRFLEAESHRLEAGLACFSGYQWIRNRMMSGTIPAGELRDDRGTPLSPRIFLDGETIELDLKTWGMDTRVKLTIRDCAGLINPLIVPPPLFREWIVRRAGVSSLEAAAAWDKLMDWLDADDLRRLYGAESRDYLNAGFPAPANRIPADPKELQLVLGLTPQVEELLASHADFTTTHSRMNLNTASREALMLFPGMDPDQARKIMDHRRTRAFNNLQEVSAVSGYDFTPFATWIDFCTSRSAYVTIAAGLTDSEEFFVTVRLDRGRTLRGVERLRTSWRKALPPDVPREIHLQRWQEGTRRVKDGGNRQ